MPRTAQKQQTVNVFSKGLLTEANPLVAPEESLFSQDNIDILRDGSIRRRKGLLFEQDGVYSIDSFTETELSTKAISSHEWRSVNGDDNINFLVIQVGGTLFFHDLGAAVVSTSLVGTLSLAPVQTDPSYEEEIIDTAVGKGRLFVVSRKISPSYLTYDVDTNSFSGAKLTLKIRDTLGIEEENDDPEIEFGNETPPEATDPDDDINDITNPDGIIDPTDAFDFERPSPGLILY